MSVSELDIIEKRLVEHLFNMIQVDRNVHTMYNFFSMNANPLLPNI